MATLRNRGEPWFHLTVWFAASDATTAERAHDDAIAAICQGEGVGAEHSCKNSHISSTPSWLDHERTGRAYYLDVDYSAPSRHEAGRLREQAIDAISRHAEVKITQEPWPCALWWDFQTLPIKLKRLVLRSGLARWSRPPGRAGAAAIHLLALVASAPKVRSQAAIELQNGRSGR